MGKSWFSILKRAFFSASKEKKDKKSHRSSKKWFGKSKTSDDAQVPDGTKVLSAPPPPPSSPPPPPPPATPPTFQPSSTAPPPSSAQPQWPALPSLENVRPNESSDEQSRHAYSVAIATAVAAEAAVVAAQAAAEVIRLTSSRRSSGNSREEEAAIRIQTAYRGYMARRALRALKELNKLKTLIQGQSVRRQSDKTLRCMQTLSRMQYQIRERRIRMSEDKFARYSHLVQQKHEKAEPEEKRISIGDGWDDSTQSKQEIEARLLKKKVAAQRRERALAYAHTHQQTWRSPSKREHQTFMDPHDPHWGWSWLERWMAARPWENPEATEKKPKQSITFRFSVTPSETGQRERSYGEAKKPTPRAKTTAPTSKSGLRASGDDEATSSLSLQSRQLQRRLSTCSSESVESSPPPKKSFLTPRETAKSRARLLATKRRLSFSEAAAPPTRRISAPPKVDSRR